MAIVRKFFSDRRLVQVQVETLFSAYIIRRKDDGSLEAEIAGQRAYTASKEDLQEFANGILELLESGGKEMKDTTVYIREHEGQLAMIVDEVIIPISNRACEIIYHAMEYRLKQRGRPIEGWEDYQFLAKLKKLDDWPDPPADCLGCEVIEPCDECGQTDHGQQGEYHCSKCGLPRLWGDEVLYSELSNLGLCGCCFPEEEGKTDSVLPGQASMRNWHFSGAWLDKAREHTCRFVGVETPDAALVAMASRSSGDWELVELVAAAMSEVWCSGRVEELGEEQITPTEALVDAVTRAVAEKLGEVAIRRTRIPQENKPDSPAPATITDFLEAVQVFQKTAKDGMQALRDNHEWNNANLLAIAKRDVLEIAKSLEGLED